MRHINVNIEDEDREDALQGLLALREGADRMIAISERKGIHPRDAEADMVMPFELDDGITVVVIKRTSGGSLQ